MKKLSELLGLSAPAPEKQTETGELLSSTVLPEHQRDQLERDMMVLDDEYGVMEKKVQKEAEKEVQEAAEDSLKKLHLIQLGRCPVCGEHLHQHLFATVCESCDFHNFEQPKRGPIKVHLRNGSPPVQGEHSYILKNGDVLVMRDDVVIAKVPKDSLNWVEYVWTDEEIDQRYQQLIDRMKLTCGWCNSPCDPEKDGFHLVQIALGSNQERYVFCTDECYEGFRKLYPARVHRNCYDRNCADCNQCVKRYDDETDGIRLMAKDFLKVKGTKS